jgi:hypothetical protein
LLWAELMLGRDGLILFGGADSIKARCGVLLYLGGDMASTAKKAV